MRSAFMGFNIATTGLYSARAGLDVTNHNIANANNEGFSRQKIHQIACTPLAGNSKGMLGTGSIVDDIYQIREFYLDKKYWGQTSKLGEASSKSKTLREIELLFNEPSDTGINTITNNFFNMLQNLANNTSDESLYSNVREEANALTNYFNETAGSLISLQEELNSDVKVKVDNINSFASQIKSLNELIFQSEVDGSVANDLRDQRSVLIDKLSAIANVTVREIEKNPDLKNGVYSKEDRIKSNKQLVVEINGQVLVDHFKVNKLVLNERDTKVNPEDCDDLYDIRWQNGLDFDEHSSSLTGELKGLIDLRDGNNFLSFTGKVDSIDDVTKKVVVSDVNRSDLQVPGEIKINGKMVKYTSFKYDEDSDSIEFTVEDTSEFTNDAKIEIGEKCNYKGIPHYLKKLNTFVRTIARAMNEGEYMDGTDIPNIVGNKNGYSIDGDTGNYIFTYDNGAGKLGKGDFKDYNNITASNFSISKEFDNDPKKIAISYDKEISESENDMIHEFIKLKNDDSLFAQGEIQDFISSIIGEVAVDAQQAKNVEEIQENIINNIKNQKQSISGVDLNEEMNNMIKFQTAYNAAAKMISVMSEIYDVTINNMGI